eukprot:Nitzschia sp. Nitz4//scaffold187_size43274//18322//19246//NITZ4_007335-RA/size43274-snap-gene-0.60-mRNA-1//1//CDS//3329539813//6872//frame0
MGDHGAAVQHNTTCTATTQSTEPNSSALFPGAFPSHSQAVSNKDQESIKRRIYPSPVPPPCLVSNVLREKSPKQHYKDEARHPYLGLLQMTQPSPIPSSRISCHHGDVDPGDVPISHDRQSVNVDHDVEAQKDDRNSRDTTTTTTCTETLIPSSVSNDPPMLVAELAPNEDDVAARVALQVQQQFTSEWQRLRQEVQAQLRTVPTDVVMAVSMEDPTRTHTINPTSNTTTTSSDVSKKNSFTTMVPWRQRCGCCDLSPIIVAVLIAALFLLVLGAVAAVVSILRASGDGTILH